jgi:large subunit ribosomal protein L10
VSIGLEQKQAIISELNAVAANALSAVVADSRGISVNDMVTLRKLARSQGVSLHVVRNTLAKRAVLGTSYECLGKAFKGPSIIAFSNDHPGAGASLFKDFSSKNQQFEIKALSFEGNFMPANQLDILASLPTYTEAVARLMSVMQGATSKLVRILAAIRDQKIEQTV